MRQPLAWPASVTACALMLCLLGVAGCSSLPSWWPKPVDTSAAAAPAAAAASAAEAASPDQAVYRLEVVAPTPPLNVLLSTYLDLARFQNVPTTDGITTSELDRLIAAAPAQARALLETEGYFNADVKVERVANAGPGKPLLRIVVTPGPRASVEKLTLNAEGPLQTAATSGDATALQLQNTLRLQWALQPGQPFRDGDWSSAKNATLARLRADGYPTATWKDTSAQVDATQNTVKLDLLADSGALFRIGAFRIEGLKRYTEDSVKRLANFGPGMPYNEKLLLDFQEKLQTSGLFEGAAVEIDPNPDTAEAAPVLVRLREQPLQQATFGVGYSANTGPRLSIEHTHRQPFGWEWIAKNKLELGPDLKSWSGELTSYPLPGNYRNLVAGSAERLRSAEELRTSWSARLGRTQDTPRIERLYYAELTHVRLDTVAGTSNSDAVSGNYHWVWRDVDSVLLPTRGTTLSAQAALGYARSTTADNGPFGRTYARLTWYHPLGDTWYTTWRAEAGQVFAGNTVGVPDTLLFRAGGDDSVRGYGYRTLGPVVNGAVTSARVLFTGSAEIARPISARYPAFWWAAFVDAGNAAGRWQDLRPALGYGAGLRWRSPVGPLRLDLAYGQDVKRFRMHFSVGIAF